MDFNKVSNLTPENIDKHIFMHAEKLGIKNLARTDLRGINLCQVYTMARPVLSIARGLLFFKPTWQNVITGLMTNLDTQCGIS